MSLTQITMTYKRPTAQGDLTITLKGQDYGSEEAISRRQSVGETDGDQLYVYDHGVDALELTLNFLNLTAQERADLEWWFKSVVGYGFRWFEVSLPAPVRMEVVRPGALIGGVVIQAGDFRVGQYLLQDNLIYKVRMLDSEVIFIEDIEGHYSTSFRLRALLGFVPLNKGGP